ncbi:MAG: trehalose-phosphatase [Thermoleophilia bacterium]
MHKQKLSTTDEIQQQLEPLVAAPADTTIFLDLDGTLAPIVNKPADVAVPPEIVKLIRKLAQRYLAIAIVSGRQATEARRIVGLDELVYVGNHGFETMLPGRPVVVSPEAQPYIPAIRELTKYCRDLEGVEDSGVWLEDKMATLSVHYRRAPDPDAAKAFIEARIIPQAEKLGLKVNEGRMVVEIKPPAKVNKGLAVGHLIDRLSTRQAIYAGDDTTDIDALKELRRRKKKQLMIGVGVVSSEMPAGLPRYADLLVAPRGGVETLLRLLAGEEP